MAACAKHEFELLGRAGLEMVERSKAGGSLHLHPRDQSLVVMSSLFSRPSSPLQRQPHRYSIRPMLARTNGSMPALFYAAQPL